MIDLEVAQQRYKAALADERENTPKTLDFAAQEYRTALADERRAGLEHRRLQEEIRGLHEVVEVLRKARECRSMIVTRAAAKETT